MVECVATHLDRPLCDTAVSGFGRILYAIDLGIGSELSRLPQGWGTKVVDIADVLEENNEARTARQP
jgi:hypothetical protein